MAFRSRALTSLANVGAACERSEAVECVYRLHAEDRRDGQSRDDLFVCDFIAYESCNGCFSDLEFLVSFHGYRWSFVFLYDSKVAEKRAQEKNMIRTG